MPETRTSPGPAAAATRAPMLTAMPVTFPSCSSHSPVWTPARTPLGFPSASTTDRAQEIARAGPSKVAKKPSPAVSSSWPRKRASSRRTRTWWSCRRSRQARSPLGRPLGRAHDVREQNGGQHGVGHGLDLRPREEGLDLAGHVLEAVDFERLGASDPLREIEHLFAQVPVVEDEGGNADRLQHLTEVGVAVDAVER